MKTLAVCLLSVLLLSAGTNAGVDRVEISPAMLVNLGQGHSGSAMGAAVTGDVFFNQSFAFRATVGFTKDRYYPRNEDYSEADYGFWLTLAPYAELSAGKGVRPYVSLLGSFSSGPSGQPAVRPIGMSDAPVSRLNTAPTRANAYSFGGSLGSKVQVAGPISVFGEVTHYFYSSISNSGTFSNSSVPDVTFNYDWDETPTYLSVGLTYSLGFDKEK